MKHFLKIYAFTLVTLLILSGCSSDEQFSRRRSPQERAEQLRAQLDLTDEQTAAVEKIYIDMDKKMSELRDRSSGDREAMRGNFRSLREETDKAIEEVLFEDQIEKYREFNEQRRQNMRQRNPDGGRD